MRTDPKHLDSQHCKDTLSPCIPKSPKANCILNSKAKAAAFKVPDIKMHLQVMEQQRKKGKIKTDFSSVLKNSNANITSVPHICSRMTYCALRITSSDQVYMYHVSLSL
jgi:glyceraldehyde-3-phosphate dehydrogenase/erythrose-4-phosphate dehydrogenase